MKAITCILHAVAGWLTTTGGFLATNATWLLWLAASLVWHWSQVPFLTYLSVLAIVEASVILVAGRTSEAAVQLKLAEIILALDGARNQVATIEKADEKEARRIAEDIKYRARS